MEPVTEQNLEALYDIGTEKRQRVLTFEQDTKEFTRRQLLTEMQQQQFHQGSEGTVFPAEMAMDADYVTATAPTQGAFANSTPGQFPICFELEIVGL